MQTKGILIVPDGIETQNLQFCLHLNQILIVPDGIETYQRLLPNRLDRILIVPDGIETLMRVNNACFIFYFNRTRWN